jgi:pentatricopeptide repeat protein
MEMISDPQAMLSILMKAGYTLRYEITFGILLLAFWFMGQLAGVRKKPKVAKEMPMAPKLVPKARPSKPATIARGEESAPSSVASVDTVDSKYLRDPAWLVPQITKLCREQVQQAIALYRTAIKAGLKLEELPVAECRNLFMSLVTAAIRICQMDEAMRLLQDLRHHGIGVSSALLVSVVKLCTSKHLFGECLKVYDFVVEDDPSFALTDKSIWSCLLFCAIEVRAYQRCNFFFERLKDCGTPSNKDYGNMVRLASLHGDWQLSLKLIEEMRAACAEIDSVIYNTSLATCVAADQVDQARKLLEDMQSADGVADVITYNTLMKGYAKAGRMSECKDLFDVLRKRNITPSQVTYGILLDGFINEAKIDEASKLFQLMHEEGVTMNTVLYTTLIKGFARAGEVDRAMAAYEQMRTERSVPPDLITFSILIKANCDVDRLEIALKLLEAMLELQLRPDEVVFNNLLAGCARQAHAELGKRLYSDMIKSGIRPSNATFSILIRLFHQCKLLEDAVDMIRTEPSKHKVDPEPRLYQQLIQSCIRERQGRRAVEVYEMMLERSIPTISAHSSMISTCVKLNMYDTAAEILAIAAEKGGRVDATDVGQLLEGAVRKKKTQVAHAVAGSMAKLGMRPDPKLGRF